MNAAEIAAGLTKAGKQAISLIVRGESYREEV